MPVEQIGIAIVILCTLIEGAAQISLKKSTLAEGWDKRWITLGVALFAAEAVLYTHALQWLDISVAYPLGALCFVVVTLLSRWLLREIITPKHWLGIGFIMGGCALIAS